MRVPYWYGLGLACVLGIPSCAGWYYAMRVSALLARDDIIECAKGVSDEGLKNDEVWTATVATKTLALASHTMKHLSGGFGRGTGLAAIGCWLMALAKFTSFLELTTRDYVSSSWAAMGASPRHGACAISQPFDHAVHILQSPMGMSGAPVSRSEAAFRAHPHDCD